MEEKKLSIKGKAALAAEIIDLLTTRANKVTFKIFPKECIKISLAGDLIRLLSHLLGSPCEDSGTEHARGYGYPEEIEQLIQRLRGQELPLLIELSGAQIQIEIV